MFKMLSLAAIAAASTVGVAQAALVYPTTVIAADQNGTPVAASRSNTASALGAADGTFYSLGLGGSLTLDFGQRVGGKGVITEATYNTANYFEYADLSTSLDGVTWTSLASVFNADAVSGAELFAASPFRFLKLVDVSPAFRGRDGFDLDAVGFAPVPLPAAGLALAAGLAGLATLRRRRG